MQLQLARTLASEVEISDCTSPYSTCLRGVPERQTSNLDGLRHTISYHRPSGQRLYTEETLSTHPLSNTTRTMGKLSLFGTHTLCRFEDGSSNVFEQTGVYADSPIEATIHTEACTVSKPQEPSFTDGAGRAAAQGFVTGLSQVAYQYMRQEGYGETESYSVTSIVRLITLWFMFAAEHYSEASVMGHESPITEAMIRACLSIIQLLFMMGISMLLANGAHYAGERARVAGWIRTGHVIETVGRVAPALTYVDGVRQHGLINTIVCGTTGLATQVGVGAIGSSLLKQR